MIMAAETVTTSETDTNEDWRNADFLTFDESDQDEEESNTNRDEARKYGREGLIADHSRANAVPPWISTVSASSRLLLSINPLVRLHNEIVDFCKLMEPKPFEIKQREELVVRLRRLAESCFGGDCKVTVFGSQATGLLLPTSDIDIVIELKDENVASPSLEGKPQKEDDTSEWAVMNSNSAKSPRQRLAAVIRDEWFDELEYLEVLENTTVPLVKLTTKDGISVDISFNQANGIKAAQLMTTFLRAMPPLRPLTFVLKYFLASRGLNEPYTGGTGSYLLQLMIVSFLQHRERDSYNHSRPIAYNLGCLLMEFLELYGSNMNYMTTGISVRHDGSYFRKGALDRKEHFHIPSRPFSLAMENPFEHQQDVGKSSFRINIIQRSFDVAYRILLLHVAEPVLLPKPSSILATIITVSPEMRNRAAEAGSSFSRKGAIYSKENDEGEKDLCSPPHKRRCI